MALKRARNLSLGGRIVAIIAATLAISFIVDFGQKAINTYRIYQEINALEKEVAAAQAENQFLKEQLTYSATDAYIEEAARQLLHWVKPGDVQVVILSEGEANADQNSQGQTNSEGAPFWQLWWDLFFGDGQ